MTQLSKKNIKCSSTAEKMVRHKFNFCTRPNASDGNWLFLLLPLAILWSAIKWHTICTDIYKMSIIMSITIILANVAFLWYISNHGKLRLASNLLLQAVIAAIVLVHTHNTNIAVATVVAINCTIGVIVLRLFILHRFPKCFTIGEAAIVAQAVIYVSNFTVITTTIRLEGNAEIFVTVQQKATIIVQLGLFGVITMACLCHCFRIKRMFAFLIALGFCIVHVIVIPLLLLINENPILWIVSFTMANNLRIKMFIYWTFCICSVILVVVYHVQSAQKVSTRVRKLFHVLAIAIFLPGLLYACKLLYLATGIVLGILLVLELIRIIGCTPLAQPLQNAMVIFQDDKDAGNVALTPIYLFVGFSMPLWLHPGPCDVTDSAANNLLPLLSGVLSVGIGDTAASVIGSKFGRYNWTKNSKKTIEGTAACFLSQLLFVSLLVQLGHINLSDTTTAIQLGAAVLVTTFIETATSQVDNLILPIVMYIFLV